MENMVPNPNPPSLCPEPRTLNPEPYPMPNAFDPYREALVIEQTTIWPDTLENRPDRPSRAGADRNAFACRSSPSRRIGIYPAPHRLLPPNHGDRPRI